MRGLALQGSVPLSCACPHSLARVALGGWRGGQAVEKSRLDFTILSFLSRFFLVLGS